MIPPPPNPSQPPNVNAKTVSDEEALWRWFLAAAVLTGIWLWWKPARPYAFGLALVGFFTIPAVGTGIQNLLNGPSGIGKGFGLFK